MKLIHKISQWLEVSSTDLDDARRRKLLNILLIGIGTLTLLALLWQVIFEWLDPVAASQYSNPYPSLLLALTGEIIVLLINVYVSGWVAGAILSWLLTTAIAFSDRPENIVAGGLTFILTIPILMTSMLVRPYASFFMAAYTTILLGGIALSAGLAPNIIFSLGFFAVAFVSWLSSRSLENALKESRTLNTELDQRVQQRTIELAQANEQLKELDRLKSQFVSMISHELRTPLGVIQGFTEMLVDGVYGEIDDQQMNALNRIREHTRRLQGLVNDLLDQARLEAGRMSLHMGDFSPRDLGDEVYESMYVLAEEKNLDLTVTVAETVPDTLRGDYKRLLQILINLVNNAIKFTNEGWIHVSIDRRDEDAWAIEVADSGIGISQKEQEFIFDPFRQAEDSDKSQAGSGLGLSIVKHLANLMGGYVLLTSKVGHGSVFTVILPLSMQEGES